MTCLTTPLSYRYDLGLSLSATFLISEAISTNISEKHILFLISECPRYFLNSENNPLMWDSNTSADRCSYIVNFYSDSGLVN